MVSYHSYRLKCRNRRFCCILYCVHITKIETIVLDDGASTVVVAVIDNDKGTGAIEFYHTSFIWDIQRMNSLV